MQEMPVIVICGTPGTGKSSIADMFADYGFHVIHLSKFVIERGLYRDYDKRREAYVVDEDKLLEELGRLLKEKKKVVIEGISAEILPRDWVDLCIVLTCEPYVLEKRLLERNFPVSKVEENLEAERMGVILGDALSNYGEAKIIVLDTTHRGPREVFKVILDELRRREII